MFITKKTERRGPSDGLFSLSYSNEGGDSKWFINYLSNTIKKICVENMSWSERKREKYKEKIKKPGFLCETGKCFTIFRRILPENLTEDLLCYTIFSQSVYSMHKNSYFEGRYLNVRQSDYFNLRRDESGRIYEAERITG